MARSSAIQTGLWLATWGGAVRYDGSKSDRITATGRRLADNAVRRVFRDRANTLWFATARGLTRYDGTVWASIDARDGLPNDNVYDVQQTGPGGVARCYGRSAWSAIRFTIRRPRPRSASKRTGLWPSPRLCRSSRSDKHLTFKFGVVDHLTRPHGPGPAVRRQILPGTVSTNAAVLAKDSRQLAAAIACDAARVAGRASRAVDHCAPGSRLKPEQIARLFEAFCAGGHRRPAHAGLAAPA